MRHDSSWLNGEQILSNLGCDKLPAPVSLASHTGGTQEHIIEPEKTGRGEGAALLMLMEDKILASQVVSRSCLTLVVTNSRLR